MIPRSRAVILALALVAAACSGGGEPVGGDDTPSTTVGVVTSASAADSVVASQQPSLDLDGELLMFAPVPPWRRGVPESLPNGSEDFWQLFADPSSWADVAAEIDAVKLHGWMFRFSFTDEQVRTVIAGLDELGLPLVVEMEPLDPPDPVRCAHNESYEGPFEIETLRRIKALGGHVAAIAIEQPHSFNTILSTPTACQDPVEETAAQVIDWISRARSIFPDVPVGSIEGVWSETTANHYASWLDTFEEMNGEPFAFIHVDVGWWLRPDWPTLIREIEMVADARGVPFGVLWNGNGVESESEWIPRAAERIVTYGQVRGGSPDHTTIQRWTRWPDRVLPADDVEAMANLIRRYRSGLADVAPPAVGANGLSGVVSIGGAPAPGLPIVVERTPQAGQVQSVRLEGVVPEGALRAVAQIRSNDEFSVTGPADVRIHEISYVEARGAGGPLPNGAFDRGLTSWGAYGEGADGVTTAAVDGEQALSLVIDAGAATFVDSVPFLVNAGESYSFEVTFSFVPGSEGTTAVALIFLDDDAEFGRAEVVVQPYAEVVGQSTTSTDGSYVVGPAEAFDGDVSVTVRVPGNANLLGGRWEGSLG